MKIYTDHIYLETNQREELINITKKVKDILKKSNIKEGILHAKSMHTTSAVIINDAESGLLKDIKELLDNLVPNKDYKHHLTGEDNAPAHLKKMLLGCYISIPITKSQLDLGTWEQIFYAEFDGQRRKKIIIKIIGK